MSEPVTSKPAFKGQYSVEKERLIREAIWGTLQNYAHGTGALAGDDVVKHFLAESERHWRNHS